MSENLSILDGELRRQFAPVDRLSVDNQGGGVSPWVISDFLDISTLSVSENGLYLAAEEEYDCYEEVEVDISEELGEGDYRRITGKDPNLDPNNDYAAGLDENGNLTKEMIPAAIHIVVPPRKRKYEDGEVIDFTGIHVYLMDGNNKRYVDESYPTGEIPFNELIFPVTIASGGESGDSTVVPDGNPLDVPSFSYIPAPEKFGSFLFCVRADDESGGFQVTAWIGEGGRKYTYNGKTASYGDGSVGFPFSLYPTTTYGNPQDYIGLSGPIAWLMMYGGYEGGGSDTIPVQWIRSDGTILEDTFKIEVGESEEGEDQPDPWAGSADVSWGGHHYNLNRRIVPEVHYANGYLWQEGTSEYTVEQAASMGWLILIR
jgi:hypothetical protein